MTKNKNVEAALEAGTTQKRSESNNQLNGNTPKGDPATVDSIGQDDDPANNEVDTTINKVDDGKSSEVDSTNVATESLLPSKKDNTDMATMDPLFASEASNTNSILKRKFGTPVLVEIIQLNESQAHMQFFSTYQETTSDFQHELIESIKAYGLLTPIVVTKDNNIVDGVQRVEAFRTLGNTHIMAFVMESTDEEGLIEFAIEHNMKKRKSCNQKVNEIRFLKNLYQKPRGRKSSKNAMPVDPGNTNTMQKISKRLGLSVGSISNLLAVANEEPALLGLIDSGELTINGAFERLKKEKMPARSKSPEPLKKVEEVHYCAACRKRLTEADL